MNIKLIYKLNMSNRKFCIFRTFFIGIFKYIKLCYDQPWHFVVSIILAFGVQIMIYIYKTGDECGSPISEICTAIPWDRVVGDGWVQEHGVWMSTLPMWL